MKTFLQLLLLLVPIFTSTLCASETAKEYIGELTERKGRPVVLKGTEKITTKATFKPPVEIVIEAKTDSTDLRMGYAADQVIFNWHSVTHQLRVDGGPASGHHKAGAGLIPDKKYVSIKWQVTNQSQKIFVDDELRFEHQGDYSSIDKPISIYSNNSRVTVKSITVRQLD